MVTQSGECAPGDEAAELADFLYEEIGTGTAEILRLADLIDEDHPGANAFMYAFDHAEALNLLVPPWSEVLRDFGQMFSKALDPIQADTFVSYWSTQPGETATLRSALLELLYGTGIKFVEAFDLKCSDLHLDGTDPFIRIHSDLPREIPLHESLVAALREYLSQSGEREGTSTSLFLPEGQPLTPKTMFQAIDATRRATRIWIHEFTLRKSFAVHMYMGGMHLANITAMLGMKSDALTAFYISTAHFLFSLEGDLT